MNVNTDPGCQTYNNLVFEEDIKTNIENIEKHLKNKPTSNNSYENVTGGILQSGAEMFTYLNYCPPNKLIKFYKKLFQQRSTKDIILAVTDLIKTRRNAEKSTAKLIWNNIDRKWTYLKYKIIDSVTSKQVNHSKDLANGTEQLRKKEFETLGKNQMHH